MFYSKYSIISYVFDAIENLHRICKHFGQNNSILFGRQVYDIKNAVNNYVSYKKNEDHRHEWRIDSENVINISLLSYFLPLRNWEKIPYKIHQFPISSRTSFRFTISLFLKPNLAL